MHRILLTLLLFTFLFSEEDLNFLPSFEDNAILSNLEGEPSALVAGCVNVITGDFIDVEQDILMVGAEPLVLERSYCSSDSSEGGLCKGWHFNLQGVVRCFHATNQYMFKGSFGSELAFDKLSHNEAGLCKKTFRKGFTNNACGKIGGKTNLKNLFIKVSEPLERHCKIVKGDGSFAIFQREERNKSNADKVYRLRREQKANGMEKHFHYDLKDRLNFVAMVNQQSTILQTLSFEYPSKETNLLKVSSNDGRFVNYFLGEKNSYLTDVQRPNAPSVKYIYDKVGDSSRKKVIEKRVGDKSLHINYYTSLCGGMTLHEKDRCFGKVQCLLAPVSSDSSPIVTHRFQYDQDNKDGGFCHVYNAYGQKTKYSWDKNSRLTAIEKLNVHDQAYVSDKLYWGTETNIGNLVSRVFSADVPLFCKTYSYDSSGNVIKESFYGHLTGQNPVSLVVDSEGYPIETGCDRYERSYVYSQDGLNLLLLETEGFRGNAYRYYDKTDRLAVKYVLSHGRIMQRHCYNYDDNCALISEIIDDGISDNPLDLTNVTYRKLRFITPRQQLPFGVPETIEEYFEDSAGNRFLLKSLVNFYSIEGNHIRQDYYDSNREYRYSLFWEYDSFGNVTKEINALGHLITRQYDQYSNLIEEQGPSFKTLFIYDFSNRLIRKDEVHKDRTLSTHYRYDLLGNKVASIDCYGNETSYVYDEFSRLIHVISPKVLDENGFEIQPITSMGYDPLGNRCITTDPKGNSTTALYTARGQPYFIKHPDGTEEKFTYFLHGPLETHTERNGCVTKYTRDYQDRIIRKEVYTPDGNLKSFTTAEYDAFHLLSETDAMGNTTYYSYDVFGRKKSITSKGCTETLEYDALSRVIKRTITYGKGTNETIVHKYEYDLLDRKLEEITEDHLGNIVFRHSFAYDREGRVILDTTYNANGACPVEIHYDSYGIPVESIDAIGHVTKTIKYFDYRNGLNQIVPCIEVTDPLGNTSITIQDALGREVIQVRKNAFGVITQQFTKSYDLNGNQCKIQEKVFSGDTSYEVVHLKTYDNMNRLSTLVEGFGTPYQRVTSYSYNFLGQLQSIRKPSGVYLHHAYNPEGLLERKLASDNSFHYSYEYDLNHNVIATHDEISQKSTLRKYFQDRLIEEKQASGLTVKYTYDLLGRVTSIKLPDQSSITYSYDDKLRKIARHDSNQKEVYHHTYDVSDLSGNCLSQSLLGNAGSLVQTYDKKNRLLSRISKHTNEKVTSYDPCDNVLSRNYGDRFCKYSYDDLYQLKSEEGIATHSYSFDSAYNRTLKDESETKFNVLNQILDLGYIYDADGRLIQTPSATYTYDALDRLTSVTKDQITTHYTYDSFNRRLTKSSTAYLYDGQREIATIQNGQITELRVLPPHSTDIGTAVAIELNGKPYAPIHDYSGNVTTLIDADGNLFESNSYSSFGDELSPSSNPWRFSSKRYDAESNLIYFGNRYYDPALGRWLTPDPLSYAAGSNLYAYVFNNPHRYVDPDGRFAVALPLICLTFGVGEAVLSFLTFESLATAVTAVCIAITVNQVNNAYEQSVAVPVPSSAETVEAEEAKTQEEQHSKKGKGKYNTRKGDIPRAENGDYLPDPTAEGAHTRLGTMKGRRGTYTQGVTFDVFGKFKGRTDCTDHGRPREHTNPHFHPANSPNCVDDAQPISPEVIKWQMI